MSQAETEKYEKKNFLDTWTSHKAIMTSAVFTGQN